MPGAAARLGAGAAHLGPVGHARQPRRSTRRAAAAPAAGADRGRSQAAHADPGDAGTRGGRALPLGRAPGPGAIATGAGKTLRGAHQPAVHQHPRAGRAVASGADLGVAGRSAHAGPAPRLAGPSAAQRRRARPARRQPTLRGGDLQPGPGRGLPRRRSGAAGRQPQGRGATAAACRPRQAPPRRGRPRAVRALARAGTGRIRRRAPRHRPWPHRIAALAAAVTRRAGAALHHLRAGRRLRCRRAVRRSARHRRLRHAGYADLAGGAGVRRAGRTRAGAVSGLPQGGAGRRWPVPRARPSHRPAPSPVDRHHHQRRQRRGALPARRPARRGGGAVCRPTAPRRPFPVRRAPAGTGATGRYDRLRAPGQGRRRQRAEMDGRAHAAVFGTGPRGGSGVRRSARRGRTARAGAVARPAARAVGPGRT
ncbi:hypothetical protein NB706_003616 [Xanthomonas sacchari]|nr:hypothetical protein [Xanthomonas sacchari]